MSNLKRIYITTWGYPSEKAKGNPFVKEIAEALVRRGVEVVVILVLFKGLSSIFNRNRDNWLLSEGIELREVEIQNFIPSFFGLEKLRRYFSKYQMTKSLEKISSEFGPPDAFQFHYILHSSAWLFTDFLSKNKLRYTLFEHSPGSAFIKGVSKNFGGFTDFRELQIFVQSATLRLARIRKYEIKLSELYQAQFHSLPSFISNEYDVFEELKEISKPPFTYISVGSLIPRKGFRLLIDSFKSLIEGIPSARLIIVGGGPLHDELNEQVRRLKLESSVTLTGELPKSKVLRLVEVSNVLVVASQWETFGNTVLEGMHLGKPIVSTKCDGPETIITEATGILCDQNEEAMSAALNWMYKNYTSFDSSKIAEHCRIAYSEEAVLNQLSTFYKESFGLDF